MCITNQILWEIIWMSLFMLFSPFIILKVPNQFLQFHGNVTNARPADKAPKKRVLITFGNGDIGTFLLLPKKISYILPMIRRVFRGGGKGGNTPPLSFSPKWKQRIFQGKAFILIVHRHKRIKDSWRIWIFFYMIFIIFLHTMQTC